MAEKHNRNRLARPLLVIFFFIVIIVGVYFWLIMVKRENISFKSWDGSTMYRINRKAASNAEISKEPFEYLIYDTGSYFRIEYGVPPRTYGAYHGSNRLEEIPIVYADKDGNELFKYQRQYEGDKMIGYIASTIKFPELNIYVKTAEKEEESSNKALADLIEHTNAEKINEEKAFAAKSYRFYFMEGNDLWLYDRGEVKRLTSGGLNIDSRISFSKGSRVVGFLSASAEFQQEKELQAKQNNQKYNGYKDDLYPETGKLKAWFADDSSGVVQQFPLERDEYAEWIAVSPDGNHIAVSTGSTFVIFAPGNGEIVRVDQESLIGKDNNVSAVLWGQENKSLYVEYTILPGGQIVDDLKKQAVIVGIDGKVIRKTAELPFRQYATVVYWDEINKERYEVRSENGRGILSVNILPETDATGKVFIAEDDVTGYISSVDVLPGINGLLLNASLPPDHVNKYSKKLFSGLETEEVKIDRSSVKGEMTITPFWTMEREGKIAIVKTQNSYNHSVRKIVVVDLVSKEIIPLVELRTEDINNLNSYVPY